MYDFDKIKGLIIDEYKEHYLFSHCLLSSFGFPHELDLVILDFQFDAFKNKLINIKYDELICFAFQYLMVANIKKMKNESFGFPKDSYFGSLTDFLLNEISHYISTGEMIKLENLSKEYNINTITQNYNKIDPTELLNIKTEIDKIWETEVGPLMPFIQLHIKNYLRTDLKYYQ